MEKANLLCSIPTDLPVELVQTIAAADGMRMSVINQIEGQIITLRDGRNQVNFRRPVAKQQLSAPSWVNARFKA